MNKFFFAVVAFAAFCFVSVQAANDNKVLSPNPQKQTLTINNLGQQLNLPEGTWASVVYANEYLPEDDDCSGFDRPGNFSYLSKWIPSNVRATCSGCTRAVRDGLCRENRLVWNGTQNGPLGMNIYVSLSTKKFLGRDEPIVATINWQEVPPQGYFIVNNKPQDDSFTTTWTYTGDVPKKEKTVSYELQLALRFWNGPANEVDDSPYTLKWEWGNGEVTTNSVYTFVPGSNWYVATAKKTYNWRVGQGNAATVSFNGRVTITDKDRSSLVRPFKLILKRK